MVPKGTKRPSPAINLNAKKGCALMVKMGMDSSQLLMLQIIFTGVFGAKLMKNWSDFDEALALFTENSWQTNATLMIYLSHIRMQHAHVADVGMMLDKASTHCSDEVKEHVDKTNSYGPP